MDLLGARAARRHGHPQHPGRRAERRGGGAGHTRSLKAGVLSSVLKQTDRPHLLRKCLLALSHLLGGDAKSGTAVWKGRAV